MIQSDGWVDSRGKNLCNGFIGFLVRMLISLIYTYVKTLLTTSSTRETC